MLWLRIGILPAIFACISAYTMPQTELEAYDDQFFQIRMDNKGDMEEFAFYYQLNGDFATLTDPHLGLDELHYRPVGSPPSLSVTVRWPEPKIRVGDVLSYVVVVQEDGKIHTSRPRNFSVTEIRPAHQRSLATLTYENVPGETKTFD